MRFRTRLVTVLSIAATAGALVSANITPAQALSEVCNNADSRCINNWNGSNTIINMYYQGASNNDFTLQLIDPCNSNPPDTVTGTCPFNVGSGMNNRYLGHFIFRVHDSHSGLCVGTAGQGEGWEGSCGTSTGAGARIGVILVQGVGACYYVSKYWSNQFNTPAGWRSPGVVGANLITWQNAGNGLTAWDTCFV